MSRSPGTKNEKLLTLTMRSNAYAVRCVAAGGGGDRMTAVHDDGGLRERSSGELRPPVLRRWENQRMLSSSAIDLRVWTKLLKVLYNGKEI